MCRLDIHKYQFGEVGVQTHWEEACSDSSVSGAQLEEEPLMFGLQSNPLPSFWLFTQHIGRYMDDHQEHIRREEGAASPNSSM